MKFTTIVQRIFSKLAPNRPIVFAVLAGPLAGRRLCGNAAIRPHYFVGKYEKWVVHQIQKHVKAGQVAYDVGANIGYISLIMAKQVSSSGEVHSFEPTAGSCRTLMVNAHMNRDLPLHVHQVAIADEVGVEPFSFYEYDLVSGLGDHSRQYSDACVAYVRVDTMDNLCSTYHLPEPDFVKIDVEGAEVRVLNGMRHTLTSKRPTLLIEVHSTNLLSCCQTILTDVGYECSIVSDTLPAHLLCTHPDKP